MTYSFIDFLKGIGIISVVLLHALTNGDIVYRLLSPLLDLAVPILTFCMGMTGYLSYTSKSFNVWEYLIKKKRRYIPAWAFMVLVAGVVNGGFWYGLWYYAFFGLLPSSGPGNYFLGVIVQSVLLLPMMCWAFQRMPISVLATAFYTQLAYTLFSGGLEPGLQEILIFGYVFTLAVGIGTAYLIKRKWIAAPQIDIWPVNALGRASYHIFLVQIVYFCIPLSRVPQIASIAFCLIAGYTFMLCNSFISEQVSLLINRLHSCRSGRPL